MNLLNTHLPFKIGQMGDIKISIDGASLIKYRKERTEALVPKRIRVLYMAGM